MTKFRKRVFVRVFVVLFVVAVVLINPFPMFVSASEDVVSGALTKFNITPAPAPVPAPTQNTIDTPSLNKYMTVESAFLGLSDNVSIYFKDLNSGKEFSVSPDKSWIPASIIKAFVAADAFYQRHQGFIDFNSTVTVSADSVVANPIETDEFPRLREGTQVTIGQLVQAMVIQSDNTAYNTLLDVLDRRNIETFVKSLGIENTIVGEKLNVDDNQQRADSVNPGYQFNVTTAGDYEKLFDLMYNHKVPDSDELLSIFRRQKLNSMIPAMIPADTPVAHKTGEWAPIYHDGGIVYKPGSPFIISLFSNSNNPSDLAKLAQIAYYQDVNHVDVSLSKVSQQKTTSSSVSRIYLADTSSFQNVLAASTSLVSPVTAGDLGITTSDLETIPTDQTKIPYTLITPASPLYGLKIFIENFRLSQTPDSQKADLQLSFARERLSELKSISGVSGQNYIQTINSNFQDNLKGSATLAEKNPDKDTLLLKAKEISDLHFMVLGSSSAKVASVDKAKFIDDVSKTLVRNEKEVVPIIKNSPLALATKTEPVVGVIQSVDNGVATVTLDNGKSASVTLTDATKVRAFNDPKALLADSLKSGDKIAVIGKAGVDGKITPAFIMKNVPKTIPKTQGIIIEIQPQNNLIKIQNSSGIQQDVQLNDSTSIQGKDTGVSLEGIKAGTVVTVVGTTPSAGTQTAIQAQRVTINVNGTGKGENVVKTPAPKTNSKPQEAPPPKKDEKPVTVTPPPTLKK